MLMKSSYQKVTYIIAAGKEAEEGRWWLTYNHN